MQPVHRPSQPSWDCDVCGQPWPCPTKQAVLIDLYRGYRRRLGEHLGSCYMDMLVDLPDVEAEALWARVFGWIPREVRRATSSYSR